VAGAIQNVLPRGHAGIPRRTPNGLTTTKKKKKFSFFFFFAKDKGRLPLCAFGRPARPIERQRTLKDLGLRGASTKTWAASRLG